MKEEGKVRQELVRQRTVCWSGWKLILFGGGAGLGFLLLLFLWFFFFFKPIVSIQVLSALEHFWPIVAKSY